MRTGPGTSRHSTSCSRASTAPTSRAGGRLQASASARSTFYAASASPSSRARRFLELSRGEQRRVLIARGVAFEPTVLLLDEPASGLDARARVELNAMLELVARECTLVCAAHLPGDLPTLIGRYLRIDSGRVETVERDRRERASMHLDAAPSSAATNGETATAARCRRSADRAHARGCLARGPARAARRHVATHARRALARDRSERIRQEQLLASLARPAAACARRRASHGRRLGYHATSGSFASKSPGCPPSCKRPIVIRRRCAPASRRASPRASV